MNKQGIKGWSKDVAIGTAVTVGVGAAIVLIWAGLWACQTFFDRTVIFDIHQ
ncbi:hypothetical protein ACIOMQ_37585 [Streptomyces sp. NPDC087845]|uniref:hypothetical protein n=1 Tax=Streptomyces sp. NPDC087845 TaxID=3365806 RepID=UPI0038242F83